MAYKKYEEIMTVKEVAEYLKIGRTQAYELMRQEDFPSFRVGSKSWRVNFDALLRWVEESGCKDC